MINVSQATIKDSRGGGEGKKGGEETQEGRREGWRRISTRTTDRTAGQVTLTGTVSHSSPPHPFPVYSPAMEWHGLLLLLLLLSQCEGRNHLPRNLLIWDLVVGFVEETVGAARGRLLDEETPLLCEAVVEEEALASAGVR
jgi:hypothetical protein